MMEKVHQHFPMCHAFYDMNKSRELNTFSNIFCSVFMDFDNECSTVIGTWFRDAFKG